MFDICRTCKYRSFYSIFGLEEKIYTTTSGEKDSSKPKYFASEFFATTILEFWAMMPNEEIDIM